MKCRSRSPSSSTPSRENRLGFSCTCVSPLSWWLIVGMVFLPRDIETLGAEAPPTIRVRMPTPPVRLLRAPSSPIGLDNVRGNGSMSQAMFPVVGEWREPRPPSGWQGQHGPPKEAVALAGTGFGPRRRELKPSIPGTPPAPRGLWRAFCTASSRQARRKRMPWVSTVRRLASPPSRGALHPFGNAFFSLLARAGNPRCTKACQSPRDGSPRG